MGERLTEMAGKSYRSVTISDLHRASLNLEIIRREQSPWELSRFKGTRRKLLRRIKNQATVLLLLFCKSLHGSLALPAYLQTALFRSPDLPPLALQELLILLPACRP